MATKTKLRTLLTFLLIIFMAVCIFLDNKGGNFKNPVQMKYHGFFQPIFSYFRKVTHTGKVIDSSHNSENWLISSRYYTFFISWATGLIDNALYVALKWSDNQWLVAQVYFVAFFELICIIFKEKKKEEKTSLILFSLILFFFWEVAHWTKSFGTLALQFSNLASMSKLNHYLLIVHKIVLHFIV